MARVEHTTAEPHAIKYLRAAHNLPPSRDGIRDVANDRDQPSLSPSVDTGGDHSGTSIGWETRVRILWPHLRMSGPGEPTTSEFACDRAESETWTDLGRLASGASGTQKRPGTPDTWVVIASAPSTSDLLSVPDDEHALQSHSEFPGERLDHHLRDQARDDVNVPEDWDTLVHPESQRSDPQPLTEGSLKLHTKMAHTNTSRLSHSCTVHTGSFLTPQPVPYERQWVSPE